MEINIAMYVLTVPHKKIHDRSRLSVSLMADDHKSLPWLYPHGNRPSQTRLLISNVDCLGLLFLTQTKRVSIGWCRHHYFLTNPAPGGRKGLIGVEGWNVWRSIVW